MKKAVYGGCLVLLLAFICQFIAFAATPVIYVAGSTSHYPYEYYEEKREEFRGIMPDILAEISEITGLDFRYLPPDADKMHLVENLQVEIVSDIDRDEALAEGLVPSDTCFVLDTAEGQLQIGFAFTEIASPSLQQEFERALSIVNEQKKEKILLSYLPEREGVSRRNWGIIIAVAGGLLLLICVFLSMLLWRQRKKQREGLADLSLIDPVTGYGNFRKLCRDYERYVSDTMRPLFALAEIRIENLYRFRELFGLEKAHNLSIKAAEILADYVGENELFTTFAGESFYFVIQYISLDNMRHKLSVMLQRLKTSSLAGEIEYPFTFCAGAYHLAPQDKDLEAVRLYSAQARCYARESGQEIAVFDPSQMRSYESSIALEMEVLQQMNFKEFIPYYLPRMDVKTGRIAGAQVLTRVAK